MATHSSILTKKIPWTEDTGGLEPTESQRVGVEWMSEHALTHIAQGTLLNTLQWPAWGKMLRRVDTCVCITDSLRCIPETDTTWQINYTSINIFLKRLNTHTHTHTHTHIIKGPPVPAHTPNVVLAPPLLSHLHIWIHRLSILSPQPASQRPIPSFPYHLSICSLMNSNGILFFFFPSSNSQN